MKAAKKKIPAPVDVPGRKVSWSPSASSDRLYGEVVHVEVRPFPHPKYYRILKTFIHVMIPDGRTFVMSGEVEDLKKIGMIAETTSEE